MPQALYMVLVDADSPSTMSDAKVKQWFADQFLGDKVDVAVGIVLAVEDNDPDSVTVLPDQLDELQFEIAERKN